MKPLYLLIYLSSACFLNAGEFSSDFKNTHDRVWLGEEYWANPMEDWLVRDGRIVCIRNGANRNVHLLTHGLSAADPKASFAVSVRMGIEENSKRGSAGFVVGVIDQETRDPRASLLMGKGLVAGVKTNGKLFIGKDESREALTSLKNLTLRLEAAPSKKKGFHTLRLLAFDGGTEKELVRLSAPMIKSETLAGNLAIGCNIDQQSNAKGVGKLSRFWFSEWKVEGGMVVARPDLAFGPILYAMHTLSRGTLNLTAQMPPLGKKEADSVRLDTKDGLGKWKKQAVAKIDPLSRTATFRVKKWEDSRDVSYRVAFEVRKKDGSAEERYFEGVIRKDPVDKKEVVVAGFTGNKATAFPNSKLVQNVGIVNPDVLFFSGDQIYEDVGGYGIHRSPAD